MKQFAAIIIVLIFFCSSAFAEGSVSKTLRYASDAAEVGQYVSDNPYVEKVGTAGDVVEVAAVATTVSTVAGASGSGIMSTMAAAGAAVGGGVVAGTVLTSGGGGFAAASLMNKYVYDGDTEADKAARVGTYSGFCGSVGSCRRRPGRIGSYRIRSGRGHGSRSCNGYCRPGCHSRRNGRGGLLAFQ